MNWCSSLLLLTGLCLSGTLTFCPPAGATTTICFPDAAPRNTGSVYGPIPQDSEIIAFRTNGERSYAYREVGYARFNIAAIPESERIASIDFHYYVNDTSRAAVYTLNPLELDPLVTSDLWIGWDIVSDRDRQSYGTYADSSYPGWRARNFGQNAVANLRASLSEGWFGIGFRNRTSGIRVDGWAETNPPYLVVVTRAGPATIHVDDDGPSDPGPGDPKVSDPDEDGSPEHPFDGIQEAVDAAAWEQSGEPDTVLVEDGLYTGEGNRDITISGKGVRICSANGPENCTIDCQGSSGDYHRGFALYSARQGSLVEGFTIRGGYSFGSGGGIYCTNSSSVVIRGNIITDNAAGYFNTVRGGGVYCSSGAVTDNLITNNTADGPTSLGGGVYASGGVVTNNIISGNSAYRGGGIYSNSWNAELINNLVVGNSAEQGGGVYGNYTAILANTTVSGNTATDRGGGIYFDDDSSLIDCIIRDNNAPTANDIYFDSGSHSLSYCDTGGVPADIIEGPGAVVSYGAGMLQTDPAFTAGDLGDYYLSQLAAGQPVNSVCIDSGSGPADGIQIPVAWVSTTGASSWTLLSTQSTATNANKDSGTADIGFHYPALDTVTSLLEMIPASGTLPFSTLISATLTNHYAHQTRRMAASIDVALASGGYYSNWRAGWTNIAAGLNYTTSWIQSVPALPSLIGANTFTLHAWDVTPAPYNQPPYPVAGDSDSDMVTLTGLAPFSFIRVGGSQ